MTAAYSLRSTADPSPAAPGSVDLRWAEQGSTSASVQSDLSWAINEWPGVTDPAVDLLRIAAAAYLADALTRRPTTFSRSIDLYVATTEPDRWTDETLDEMCALLHWLTGDDWTLTVTPDAAARPQSIQTEQPFAGEAVALLSGGLDSYLGALHLLRMTPRTTFIGHNDTAKVIRRAQRAVGTWLGGAFSPPPSYTRVAFRQVGDKLERSSRSRSLLFVALGLASATAISAESLQIPENGYTSLNVPLHPNRAGALSTRSTHPLTFERLRRITSAVEIPVAIGNPFETKTKGEVMEQTAAESPPNNWLATSWLTLSCGKLNGGRLPGGNPNLNCGLCVPCLVRRATYIAAGQTDKTPYLIDTMTGANRDNLIRVRSDDLDAVRYATAEPVDEALIDAQSWPIGFDLDAATDLVQRGINEIAQVPLP